MMEILHGMILVILVNLKMILVQIMRVKIWHDKLIEIKEVKHSKH